MRLENKIGIVTAAASGMGRAGAIRFAREGAAVGVVDIDQAGVDAVVGEIFGCDASLCRDDRAEGSGVVAADTVEVDAEDEAAVGGSQNEAPRKLRAASMKPKSFGVA